MFYPKTLIVICSLIFMSCAAGQQSAGPDPSAPEAGRRALIYTCRLPDGEIVVTTDKTVAADPNAPKARVFLSKKDYSPVDITELNVEPAAERSDYLHFFEEVVVDSLARQTHNWKTGASGELTVAAKAQTDLPENERFIWLNRVQTPPKTVRYAKSVFQRVTARKPAMGVTLHHYDGVTGKVVAIQGNEVRVEFTPDADGPVEGPFGQIVVSDQGDHYRTEIQTREGQLVRVGPAVGRIAEVNPRMFRIDYSHPFGGRELTCDTRVVALENRDPVPPEPTATAGSPQPTPADAGAAKEPLSQEALGYTAQYGDMAKVVYTVTLAETDELVYTTRKDFHNNPRRKKIEGYQPAQTFGPESIMVGAEDSTFPGVGEALKGMRLGSPKKVTLSGAEVFGKRDPRLMRHFDRVRNVPTRVTLPAQEYVKRYGGFPVKGKTVAFNTYVSGRVIDVTERGAVLALAPVAEEIASDLGVTRMQVTGDTIQIRLAPNLGADFEMEKQRGKIVAIDDRQFTVDFNAPLAGEDVTVEMVVIGLSKTSRFADKELEWITDYGDGLEAAEKQGKPAVLVLYADWCGYCKKLFNTTLTDPRIRMMHDDYVWVKVNSDKDRSLKTLYEQKSFPLTVVLDSRGDVLGSISGFRPAGAYQSELMKLMKSDHKAAVKDDGAAGSGS